MDDKIEPKNEWKIRRLIIIITLLFSAFIIGYLTLFGDDTSLNQSISNGLILLSGSIISSYIFGSVWDDNNLKNIKNNNKNDNNLNLEID